MTDADPTAPLPLDPDIEVEQTPTGAPRPAHLRPAALAIVFAGGTAGAGAREALALLLPAGGGVPWVILGINLSGALLLGILLDALARRGPDRGHRRLLRLLAGTGFMGGYTTYSSLATGAAALIGSGATGAGIAYGLGTVLLGGVATWLGILIAALAHRGRARGAA
ncbi:CrcB family protein [Microbacterium sp. ARD32]|uniref:fluoride efflux transporter FluC n=1 Tax=Microbacterium sp. ARD32 TaxID=2962577 RepID=UPI0028818195|nr:CrcB family protein [Microbacterium sp. ARD32]MDT0156534.1 CrcB family protein [Microbacterium sp. ARD32]